VGKLGLGLAGVLFLFSILSIPEELQIVVGRQRNIALLANFRVSARPFSNKLIESYRYREKLVFENLDIGNYFFQGHPRERWGVEEIQKLYLAVFPLFLLGLVKLGKKMGWLLLAWSSLAIVLPVFFEVRDPSSTLPLIFTVAFLGANGTVFLFKKMKSKYRLALYLLVTLLIFEFTVFTRSYFLGLQESLFSPRRPIYQELIPAVTSLVGPGERVLVSLRMGDPLPFFKFYMGVDSLENFEFKIFNIREEKDLNKLFIDVLPDDPTPDEPLYDRNDNFLDRVEVLAQFYDRNRRQEIFVYRFK